jgi:hypothetical protein
VELVVAAAQNEYTASALGDAVVRGIKDADYDLVP